jgi:hypothetical protein
VKLYHRTTLSAAKAILAAGFRDGESRYMTANLYRGVWLSDEPVDFVDGIPSDWVAILEVELVPEAIAPYEWIEARGSRREFLVPATVVNAAGRPALTIDEP